MNNFDGLFPNFTTRCLELKSVLMPVEYLLLDIGMVSSTITGRRSAGAVLQALGRTIVYIMLKGPDVCFLGDINIVAD